MAPLAAMMAETRRPPIRPIADDEVPFKPRGQGHSFPQCQNALLRPADARHWNTRIGIHTRPQWPGEWRQRPVDIRLPGASHRPRQFARTFPRLALAIGKLPPRDAPGLGPTRRHKRLAGSPLRAVCDETPQSFQLGRGRRRPRGPLPRAREQPPLRRLRNRAGRGSSYRSRSKQVALTLFADRQRGIRSAVEMLALGDKSAGELRIGKEGLGRQRRSRNNLGDQATAFGHMNLPCGRAPDPPARRLMEFPDRDGLHVTHCDTFGPARSRPRILAVDELSLDWAVRLQSSRGESATLATRRWKSNPFELPELAARLASRPTTSSLRLNKNEQSPGERSPVEERVCVSMFSVVATFVVLTVCSADVRKY